MTITPTEELLKNFYEFCPGAKDNLLIGEYWIKVIENREEELKGTIEKKKLIEASFPGSPFTLDWKIGYNKAVEDILSLISNNKIK